MNFVAWGRDWSRLLGVVFWVWTFVGIAALVGLEHANGSADVAWWPAGLLILPVLAVMAGTMLWVLVMVVLSVPHWPRAVREAWAWLAPRAEPEERA